MAAAPRHRPTRGPHRTPTPLPTVEVTRAPFIYVVQPGDHLINIADMFRVDVQDIIDLNDIKNPNRLFVGQELLIPGYGTPPPTTEANEDAPGHSTQLGRGRRLR